MIWIKPDFEPISPCSDKYEIGNIKGTSKVGVNSNLYFLEFDNSTELTNKKKIELEVIEIAYDSIPNLKLPYENILLNIDLDYFSTENPMEHLLLNFYNITQQQAFRFAHAFELSNYCMDKIQDFPDEVRAKFPRMSSNHKESRIKYRGYQVLSMVIGNFLPSEQTNYTDAEFRELITFAEHLWCRDGANLTNILVDLKHFMEEAMIVDETRKLPKFESMHFPSVLSMIDSIAHLPFHVSNTQEIKDRFKDLKHLFWINDLKKGGITPLITISRSETDGHTPFHQVNFLLNELFNLLYELWIE